MYQRTHHCCLRYKNLEKKLSPDPGPTKKNVPTDVRDTAKARKLNLEKVPARLCKIKSIVNIKPTQRQHISSSGRRRNIDFGHLRKF